MATKTCTKCKHTYDTSNFHLYKRSKDGLDYYCKPCRHKAIESRLTEDQKIDNLLRYVEARERKEHW